MDWAKNKSEKPIDNTDYFVSSLAGNLTCVSEMCYNVVIIQIVTET